MECVVGDVTVHYVEHGTGVLVLHGAGVDHREAEACFEPALAAHGGLRRIYPDLPGMGQTLAPASLRSADDVLHVLIGLIDELAEGARVLLLGHSAGAYYGFGLTARWPDRIAALALICPLLPGVHDVPEHRPIVGATALGDDVFRSYFVRHTPAMLDRYQRFVAPAVELVDAAALERIGENWAMTVSDDWIYDGPTLVVAGRQDSTVGYAAAVEVIDHYPRSTLAVLDGAGHALPHEEPVMLAALLQDWLTR